MLSVDVKLDEPLGHPVLATDFSLQRNQMERSRSRPGHPRLLYVFVIQMVASAMEVDANDIRNLARGSAKLCRARHVAMYLMNVTLGCSFKEIGKVFGKDRTTVSYACGVVEELRDIPVFDDRVAELEDILVTVLKLLPERSRGNL
ncbi:MAG: helix-turn-helix domain-containing protein [Rhizobiaceae bacterium]|nr:helix-turn-helix domain-containing protein [Rhizobiaceae bacterium]